MEEVDDTTLGIAAMDDASLTSPVVLSASFVVVISVVGAFEMRETNVWIDSKCNSLQ